MPYNSMPSATINLSNVLPNVSMRDLTVQDSAAPIRERADLRAREDANKQQKRHDEAVEAMIKDPGNAQYYSKAYGVEITPELGGLLREPEKAQKLLKAAQLAQSLGIQSYEAKRTFTQKYMETGNLAEAGAAIQGMDTRQPLTQYQEAMIGMNNRKTDAYIDKLNRTAAKEPKLRAVPLGFGKDAADKFDLMRGVKWNNPKNHAEGLQKGSAAPLDDASMQQLIGEAAAEYQRTGNPYEALQSAYEKIGGEGGLSEGADTGYENDGSQPWYKPDDNYKYRTLKSVTPQAPVITLPDGSRVQPPVPDPNGPALPGGPPKPPAPPPEMPTSLRLPNNPTKVEYNGKVLFIDGSDLQEALSSGAKRID